jgi:hypothetical protein
MIVDDLFESGAFSYSAKKPRRGSVADLAAQKRKEQERGQQPAEPKDQRVGVAKVLTKGVAEGGIATVGWPDEGNHTGNMPPVTIGGTFPARPVVKQGSLVKASGLNGVYRVTDIRGEKVMIVQEIPNTGQSTYIPMSDLRVWTNKPIKEQGVAEGSAQEKLYKRHQELRKKSGLPDAEYYQELKQTYTLPDEERYAKQAEIKKRYGVKEQRTQCPECGGAAYEDQMLAEKNDACYHKVKSRYKVWPSAYASGALVRCRKVGAANWGNKSKK